MTAPRVAVISVHTSPLARPGGTKAGGLNVYVLELARQLAARGCQVDIFSRATTLDTPEVVTIQPGLRAVHLPAGVIGPLLPEDVYEHLPAFRDAVLAFGERDGARYDVIHSHYWLSGLVAEGLKRAWSVPHVAMFHTLGEIKNRSSLSEHEGDLRIQSERAVLKDADRVICATEQERSFIRQLYGGDPARVSVIPLGVDLDRFRPAVKADARRRLGLSDARIVLFVGRLEPLKGVDILIGAAGMLDPDLDFRILIVGGDESSISHIEQLRAMAAVLGVSDRISFVGAVSHDELPLYYNAADVCVVPSHYESFGLVAVEAMASGVPVIASRVGGLTGTVSDGETGYLIPWLCPEPFAERMELLLENEPLRVSLGSTARESVARYRWENVAEAVLEVYTSLMQQNASLDAVGADR